MAPFKHKARANVLDRGKHSSLLQLGKEYRIQNTEFHGFVANVIKLFTVTDFDNKLERSSLASLFSLV